MKTLSILFVLTLGLPSFARAQASTDLETAPNKDVPANEKVMDKELVRRAIKQSLPLVKKCYQDRTKTAPNTAGKIVVTLVIAKGGKVKSSNIKRSTLNDEVVEKCVLDQLNKQQFPEPPEGTTAVIDYPFVFESK